ncbi:MAG: 4Fe-4S dicluster domain-containing protein [Magnetococcales bacterium]|nr:4Fe-4S dicluster domain-containing protein [Magnetococcales bacterium]MBF0150648.1 4Fe-4S dicluster domain-containing protein [Magnetococcales bacterium]MBF0349331.1 4Fe-4S dicluster domain-containing protein [Magnetococcales bacterium]MBF0630464.1 4Fe-4S dicluster domain-containing protein [Magnetococcales bacterium]
MTMDRRSVLGLGGILTVGAVLAPGLRLVAAPENAAEGTTEASEKRRWGMLINTQQCNPACTACTQACRAENNVPIVGDPQRDIHWIRKVDLHDRSGRNPDRSLPVLCNHCEHPPCVHVCPTQASFVRKDGIVLVDMHRCIGCRYCMIACPYKARSLVYAKPSEHGSVNPNVPIRAKGVVEKCTFCVHRVDQGGEPACVEACRKDGGGGMLFGDLNDPKSEISVRIREVRTSTIRPDLGLKPAVHYQGIGEG